MEKNIEYKIWYVDDKGKTREKDVLFLSEDSIFVEFKNLVNNKIIGVRKNKITRYESIEEYKKKVV